MSTLKITLRRGASGTSPDQRRTLRALGLRKIGTTVERPDTPDVRGMVFRIKHMIDVEESK